MRFPKFHICARCLVIALGIIAGFLALARADMKMNVQPVAEINPANAGVSDDLPEFNAPAVVASNPTMPLVSDKSDTAAAPADSNKDPQLILNGSANPTNSLKPASAN